jgi:hypothetical protein
MKQVIVALVFVLFAAAAHAAILQVRTRTPERHARMVALCPEVRAQLANKHQKRNWDNAMCAQVLFDYGIEVFQASEAKREAVSELTRIRRQSREETEADIPTPTPTDQPPTPVPTPTLTPTISPTQEPTPTP